MDERKRPAVIMLLIPDEVIRNAKSSFITLNPIQLWKHARALVWRNPAAPRLSITDMCLIYTCDFSWTVLFFFFSICFAGSVEGRWRPALCSFNQPDGAFILIEAHDSI